VFVVNDLLAYVNGRPIKAQRNLNHIDRPHYSAQNPLGLKRIIFLVEDCLGNDRRVGHIKCNYNSLVSVTESARLEQGADANTGAAGWEEPD